MALSSSSSVVIPVGSRAAVHAVLGTLVSLATVGGSGAAAQGAEPASRLAPRDPVPAVAAPAEPATGVAAEVGTDVRLPATRWRWQREAEFRWWGVLLYQARLMSPSPVTADNFDRAELVLELEYARRFRGRSLAERSLQEMAAIEPMTEAQSAQWLDQLLAIFPGVVAGDRLAAWHQPGQGVRFYLNDRAIGDVPDPEFARRFLAVWLSRQSPDPAFQQALQGQTP